MKKPPEKKEFEALLKLDLLDVVGVSTKSEREQEAFTNKVNELILTFLFQQLTAGKEEELVTEIEKLTKDGGIEKVQEYLNAHYPTIGTDLLAVSSIAKEIIIAQNLGNVLALVNKNRIENKDDVVKLLHRLIKMVRQQQWTDFSNEYTALHNIRKELND